MMLLKSTNKALHWTAHARGKMRHYVLSEQRVKRVINSPKRIEEGIAPKTVAMMQSAGSLKHPYEIWVMVQNFGQKSPKQNRFVTGQSKIIGQKLKVISAWRYPGVTKKGDPLPDDILRELKNFL